MKNTLSTKGRLFAKYDLPFDMDTFTSQKKKPKSTRWLKEKTFSNTLKVISFYSNKAKVNQGGNCQNRHRQPVRHQKGVSFKPNWRNVASKVFSFARYLPAMDWKSLLVVPLPEGCSAYSRYTRPLAEHLYGELFMSVRQRCGQRLNIKETHHRCL